MQWLAKFFNSIFLRRRDEADLNQECAKAGAYFLEKSHPGLKDVVKRTEILNSAALGFGMGWRECEKQLGIKKGKQYVIR